jgi:hypothetical protein
MTQQVPSTPQATLAALRHFRSICPPGLRGGRAVECRDAEFLGTSDIALDAIDAQVTSSLSEGMAVDWVYRNGLLYLRAYPPGARPPSWEQVFAQEDLADVRSILGQADTGGDTP